MDGLSHGPIRLPDDAWSSPAALRALRSRDVSAIFHLARKYGISQQRIAANTGLAQGRVSRIMTGKHQVLSFDLMERIAAGFNMPDSARVAFGLAPRYFEDPSEPQENDENSMAAPNERLRSAIRDLGVSVEDVARVVDVDVKTVYRWLTLGRVPYPRHRKAVANYLGVDEGTLWPTVVARKSVPVSHVATDPLTKPEDAEPSTHNEEEDVERRELLHHLATLGISISPATHALEAIQASIGRTFEAGDQNHIGHWEEIAIEYSYAYLTVPPQHFITDVAADLVSLRLITRDITHDSPAYKDWCRIGSTLSGLIAKALSNLGHTRQARHWWQTAQTASDSSGDLETRMWIRGERLIHGLYEQRSPTLLLRQANDAITLARDHACAGLVATSTARAQALVLAGQPDAAEQELTRAEHVLKQLPASVTNDIDSVKGMGEDRLRYTETWVYAHNGRIAKADAAAQRAIQLYPASDHRSPAQIKLLQAFACTKAGDVSEGIRHAQATYEVLPPAHRTTMVNNLATRVLQPIPKDKQREPAVTAYRELVSLPASPTHKAIGS
jgi:transcriptional regulator with XRE-family HTH domain